MIEGGDCGSYILKWRSKTKSAFLSFFNLQMSKDTPKLVEQALTTLSKVVESDTNVSTIDLNLLENLNTNQSLNYIKLENNLNELEANGKHLEVLSMF